MLPFSTPEDPIIEELIEEVVQCRLCLDMVPADDPGSVNLFDLTTKDGDSLSGELLDMFQLIIEPSPQWPSIACNKCVCFMNQIRRFKQQIMTTHRILHKEIVQVQEEAMEEVEEIDTASPTQGDGTTESTALLI